MISLATAPRRLDALPGTLIATTVQHIGAPQTSAQIQVADQATATTTATATATTRATGEFTVSAPPLASVAVLVA